MAWQDRDYYREDGRHYLGDPLAALNLSVPFGSWFGARVRLHFWLLLSILFIFVTGFRLSMPAGMVALYAILLVVTVLLHEFGHRIAASLVDGSLNEMMLWPAGGMFPPAIPQTARATFIASLGGIAMNLLCAVAGYAVVAGLGHPIHLPFFNPLSVFQLAGAFMEFTPISILHMFAVINVIVIYAAIMPYYWFDGAPILQSILWPFAGLRRAISITCIVGMVIAVPMFGLALMNIDFLGMVVWAMLFASSYVKRRDSAQVEEEFAYASAATMTPAKPKRPSRLKKMIQQRAAAKTQELERQVDEILAKVAQNGMHSLTEKEKSTLERASRELRDQR